LDDLLHRGADLRVPRVHAPPHRLLQRGERALSPAPAGVLSPRAAAKARPGWQAGSIRVHRGHARAARGYRAGNRAVCRVAYAAYLQMLEAGVAREVARGVLPLATYSAMY